jgi:uncharacterized protein involved in exopolysaccharide biosynthesis
MTIGRLFGVVAHHWLVVFGLTAVVVAVVASLELASPHRYRATALLQVQAPTDSSGVISLQGTLSARERAVTILALANTYTVMQSARTRTPGLAGIDCDFSQAGQSEYLLATCTGTEPVAVARGANAYAGALQSVLDQQRDTRITALRALYAEQVKTLREEGVPASDFPAPPSYPTSREVQVIDVARVPATPFAPQPKRAIAVALVLALLLNTGIAVALERLQGRARTPEELRRALGEPVLVAIPKLKAGT